MMKEVDRSGDTRLGLAQHILDRIEVLFMGHEGPFQVSDESRAVFNEIHALAVVYHNLFAIPPQNISLDAEWRESDA